MKEHISSNRYGVWVDKKKALIVCYPPQSEPEFKEIHSGYEGKVRFKGETTDKVGLFGTTLNRESHDQSRENHQREKFIQSIVSEIKAANAVLILGSGDTRFELQNALQKSKVHHGIWIENRAAGRLDKRALELEMQKHFNLTR
jgi:hypothetical protein